MSQELATAPLAQPEPLPRTPRFPPLLTAVLGSVGLVGMTLLYRSLVHPSPAEILPRSVTAFLALACLVLGFGLLTYSAFAGARSGDARPAIVSVLAFGLGAILLRKVHADPEGFDSLLAGIFASLIIALAASHPPKA